MLSPSPAGKRWHRVTHSPHCSLVLTRMCIACLGNLDSQTVLKMQSRSSFPLGLTWGRTSHSFGEPYFVKCHHSSKFLVHTRVKKSPLVRASDSVLSSWTPTNGTRGCTQFVHSTTCWTTLEREAGGHAGIFYRKGWTHPYYLHSCFSAGISVPWQFLSATFPSFHSSLVWIMPFYHLFSVVWNNKTFVHFPLFQQNWKTSCSHSVSGIGMEIPQHKTQGCRGEGYSFLESWCVLLSP